MPGRDLAVVFNPAAGRGRAVSAVRALRGMHPASDRAKWVATERPGHGSDLAETLATTSFAIEGASAVVACGGDGTVHEVLNGLMRVPEGRRPPLGVIPLGSGNDFAWACACAMDPGTALERLLDGGYEARIDVGEVEDDKGRRAFFGNSAGMLLDGAINAESRRIRWPGGFPRYLLAALRGIARSSEPWRVRLAFDGDATPERALTMLTVGNGAREGGGFHVLPRARNDDGFLDAVTVAAMPRVGMLRLLPRVMKGRHLLDGRVWTRRFRSLVVESDRAIPIHLDGELWAPDEADVRRLAFKIHPGAIRVLR
ncbi:MAG: diacylglycerol kinase family lipid kinase [Planctomycetes bacterium]|nr:diacylglycerol kinase family lipid kinase [Planctomycetota bacterium]